ncbi:cyclase [Marivirga tractuosa]|uniref:START domain-containing protein n=1 Tax=Marivirga tractuosa (strain ATCC 23168 / DSM 4126 / NBRC 15989 / NCIMB 1408 / VKM B-1430 / H-43) TaxID=643867 RepID=E4TQZ0_MARTH|nr:START domain-containing protein [Marivirga tractuosa]ADR21690.1 hypothetical protein Ftrac_1702 [Marivirga tractuosa DSM 4126]BDD13852.1 cyclase [Marivirga tractuosa]
MQLKAPILFITSMAFCFMAHAQSNWETAMNKDDIIVYTRDEEHSDFKSFKAITEVKGTLNEVIKVLKDADNYQAWYGFTKTSKVLKEEKNVQYNYVETIFPWPFSNRDMVYKMSINKLNSRELLISLEGIPDFIPKKNGITRMQKAKGTLLLKSIIDKVEVTYQFHSEPGDTVPVWLANNSIAELPFKTLSGLKKILEKNK